jgi:serine/threonine-protein kinase
MLMGSPDSIPPRQPPASLDAPSSQSAEIPPELAHALGDRYELVRELGRGGMATVYLANDRKHGRQVAVKALRPDLAASLGAERFLREIRMAATLQHPHVLALYDSGEADGVLYYVMPYVEGESLRDRLRREVQLPVDDALRIASETADALAYAHARGIVHRDIKPENILLSNGHAVVADFGIARAVSAAGSERLTQSGIALGTPLYMSPEQGTGDSVGPASDVYALGCVLHEMLTGEPPFSGPTASAVIAKHALTEAPSVRVVRPAVSDEIAWVAQRALAKNPADRWPNATELERALHAAAAHATSPMAARLGLESSSTLHAPARRASVFRLRRLVPAVAAVIVLAVVGVFALRRGAASRVATVGPESRRIAVTYFDARGDSSLRPIADGFTEALTSALAQVPGLSVVSSGGVLPFRDGTVTLDSIARALDVGTLITGSVEPEAAGRVRVTLTLRDASGASFADTTLVRPAAQVLALRDDVIDRAAALVRRRLGDEVALRTSRAGTSDADAWALLQRGLAEEKRADAAVRRGDSVATARADAAADSLLALAEARDARWDAPPIARARLAYAQSRRRGVDAVYAAPYLERGIAHADRALAIDTTAAGLEARGLLRYWQWLLRVGPPDIGAREALVRGAQSDLERAVALDPGRADAWSSLSHLYANFKTVLDAKLAAKRGYDADPYLSTGAEALLWRLYGTSYDLGQFDDARRYCAELRRRFTTSVRGGECAVWLLSVPDAPPAAPEQAWQAAALRTHLAPPVARPVADLDGRMAVAAALAHASMLDSARRVLARVLDDSHVNRVDLTRLAAVQVAVGDRRGALATLKRFVAEQGTSANQARNVTAQHWWWRDLRNDPEFRAIFGI